MMYDDLVICLDEALDGGDCDQVGSLVAKAEALRLEPEEMLEVAEIIETAGMLDMAWRWTVRCRSHILGGDEFRLKRDYIWLRANLAWQRGDFRSVVAELGDGERYLNAMAPAKAQVEAASALLDLSVRRHVATNEYARRVVRSPAIVSRVGPGIRTCAQSDVGLSAVQHAQFVLSVTVSSREAHLAANAVSALANNDPALVTRAFGAEDSPDPETRAFQQAAAELADALAGKKGEYGVCEFAEERHRQAYDYAWRYAQPVMKSVVDACQQPFASPTVDVYAFDDVA